MTRTDPLYVKSLELVEKHCFDDATHQPDHTKRILNLIKYLAKKEGLTKKVDWKNLTLAAIFHDLGSSKRIQQLKKAADKFKPISHSEESFKIAQKFLKQEGFTNQQINKIKKIITSHGVNGINDNIEGHLLHDADLLDGIGLVGTLRIFTFGGQINRGILGSLEFTKQKINSREFRTKTGQQLGQSRMSKMLNLFKEIEKELEGRDCN